MHTFAYPRPSGFQNTKRLISLSIWKSMYWNLKVSKLLLCQLCFLTLNHFSLFLSFVDWMNGKLSFMPTYIERKYKSYAANYRFEKRKFFYTRVFILSTLFQHKLYYYIHNSLVFTILHINTTFSRDMNSLVFTYKLCYYVHNSLVFTYKYKHKYYVSNQAPKILNKTCINRFKKFFFLNIC